MGHCQTAEVYGITFHIHGRLSAVAHCSPTAYTSSTCKLPFWKGRAEDSHHERMASSPCLIASWYIQDTAATCFRIPNSSSLALMRRRVDKLTSDKNTERRLFCSNDVAYSSGICRWPSGVGASITFGRLCHHVVLTHYSCQTPIKSFKDKAEKQSTRTKRQRPKDLISSKLKIASEAKPDCRTSRSGGTRLILRCALLHRVHPELLAQRSEYCWLLAAGC